MNTVPGLGRGTFAVCAGPLPANPQRPEKLSRDPSRPQEAPRSRRGVYESTARRSRRAGSSQESDADWAVHREAHADIPVPLFIQDKGVGNEWHSVFHHAACNKRLCASRRGSIWRAWSGMGSDPTGSDPTGSKGQELAWLKREVAQFLPAVGPGLVSS